MDIISITSSKGGVGKSSLAFNLAGAFAARKEKVVLVDEDARIHTCLDWAEASPDLLPFVVTDSAGAETALEGASLLLVDTEGRPELPDMVDLSKTARLVLLPCGPSGVEVRSTIALWGALAEAGADLSHVQVVITKAPPVGTVGQQARDTLRELGVSACSTVIRHYTAHQRAAELGVLVKDVSDPRAANAWADIEQLAEEVGA